MSSEVGRISIRVMPDLDRFREELRAKLQEIEDTERGKVTVNVDVDSEGAKSKLKATLEEMRAMAARNLKVKVDVNVDKNRIQNAIEGAVSSATPKGGGGGFGGASALSALSNQGLWVGLGVAALAAPALALLSGALATLPALMAAVVAPAGAVALGLNGIKKAAEDAGLIGEGKKGKTALGEQLKELQSAVSDTFRTKLTPVFAQLDQVMGPLKASLPAVAGGISDMAAGFVNAITSASGLSQIQNIVGNIGKTLSASAPGLQSFTGGLLTLADQVAAKFPAVANWLNTVGDSFTRWVKKEATPSWFTGKSPLDTAMENLGDTLKQIGSLGVDFLKQGFDFLSDPKFGKSMHDFVVDVKSLVNDVLPGLKTFFTDLEGAIHPVADLVDKMSKWKRPDWLDSPNPDSQDPEKNGKGQRGTGSVFDSPFINGAGGMMADTIGQFAQMWVNIKLNAAQALTDIGSSVGRFVSGLPTAFSGIGDVFGTLWDTLKAGASEKLGGIVNDVVTGATQAFIGLSNTWANLGAFASEAWGNVKREVASALQETLSYVINGGLQIANEVSSWGDKIRSAASNIAHALDGIGGQMIDGFLNGFRARAAQAVTEAGEWAGKVAAAARNALGIHSPSTVFRDIGNYTAQGLGDGLAQGFPAVIQQAQSLAQQLTEAMNNGLTGQNIGKGLTDQVKQTLDSLNLESKQLKVQLDAVPKSDKDGRKAIQDQMTQVQNLKDQLSLQKDQLGYSQKYGDSLSGQTQDTHVLGTDLGKMVDNVRSFLDANVKQFESDIGISGNGAIPTIAESGIGWAMQEFSKLLTGGFSQGKTEIHVNSVDDALAAKQNLDNKRALQQSRR